MTLIELVITISIILLISTLFFPKYNIEKYQVNSFSRQLSSDLRYVRKSNMLGNFSTCIIYIKEENKSGYILRNDGKEIKKVLLPQGVKMESNLGLNEVKFKRDGSPQPSGSTLSIFNEKISKSITIVPISGRVLLKEGKYET